MSVKKPKKALVAKCGYVDFECTSSAKFDEMHRNKNRAACLNGYEQMTTPTPCVLIPFPTAKAAKAFCKAANMTTEDRAEFAAAQLFHPLADYGRAKNPDQIRLDQAVALLDALHFFYEHKL